MTNFQMHAEYTVMQQDGSKLVRVESCTDLYFSPLVGYCLWDKQTFDETSIHLWMDLFFHAVSLLRDRSMHVSIP